jgi:hypothetical protein
MTELFIEPTNDVRTVNALLDIPRELQPDVLIETPVPDQAVPAPVPALEPMPVMREPVTMDDLAGYTDRELILRMAKQTDEVHRTMIYVGRVVYNAEREIGPKLTELGPMIDNLKRHPILGRFFPKS